MRVLIPRAAGEIKENAQHPAYEGFGLGEAVGILEQLGQGVGRNHQNSGGVRHFGPILH